jgi:hypothetical protein
MLPVTSAAYQRIDHMNLHKEVRPPQLSTALKGGFISLAAVLASAYLCICLCICAWAVFTDDSKHIKTIDFSRVNTPDDLLTACLGTGDRIAECEYAISYYIDYVIGKNKR